MTHYCAHVFAMPSFVHTAIMTQLACKKCVYYEQLTNGVCAVGGRVENEGSNYCNLRMACGFVVCVCACVWV